MHILQDTGLNRSETAYSCGPQGKTRVKLTILSGRALKRTQFPTFRGDDFPVNWPLQNGPFYLGGAVLSQKATFWPTALKTRENAKSPK